MLLIGEPTSSPHKMIREALAISYAPDLRVVQNTNQTAVIVAQAPGALSYISTAHDLPERSKLIVVDSDVKLPLALYWRFARMLRTMSKRSSKPPRLSPEVTAVLRALRP